MKRRDLLSGLGALGTASLAGCLGGTDAPGTESPATVTATPTPTVDPDPETTFAITDRSCGSAENDATVTFGGDAVEVTGTIGGSDTCDTAELARVGVSDDTLTVLVRTVREETTGTMACAQCLTDIEYTATVRFEGALPGEVEVVHESRGETVTAARAER